MKHLRISILLFLAMLPLFSWSQGDGGRLLTVKLDLLAPLPLVEEALRPNGWQGAQFKPMFNTAVECRVVPGHAAQLMVGLRDYRRNWIATNLPGVWIHDWRITLQSRHYWGHQRLDNRGWFAGGSLSTGSYMLDFIDDIYSGTSEARVYLVGGHAGRKWVFADRLTIDVMAGMEGGIAQQPRTSELLYPYAGTLLMQRADAISLGNNSLILKPVLAVMLGLAF